MKIWKKRVITLVLALVLLVPTGVMAVVQPGADFYVTDEAGVLSPDTEQLILSLNSDLEYYCEGAQIVVVAVNYLDGMYADEYAIKLFNDWGVGDKTANNGMLLLFAVKENKGWLTAGAGISGAFSDEVADNFLNEYFWDEYDAGNYDTAVDTLFSSLIHWYEEYYKVNFTGYAENEYYPLGTAKENLSVNVPAMIWAMIRFMLPWVLFVILLAVLSDRRRYRYYYSAMCIPAPRYRFRYLFWGPHHRWSRPGGPHGPDRFGGPGMPFDPRFRPGPGSFGGRPGGFSSGHSSHGGFSSGHSSHGGFSGGHSGHSGMGHGGGGFSGGGGGGRR